MFLLAYKVGFLQYFNICLALVDLPIAPSHLHAPSLSLLVPLSHFHTYLLYYLSHLSPLKPQFSLLMESFMSFQYSPTPT